jgi:hypothetical protein
MASLRDDGSDSGGEQTHDCYKKPKQLRNFKTPEKAAAYLRTVRSMDEMRREGLDRIKKAIDLAVNRIQDVNTGAVKWAEKSADVMMDIATRVIRDGIEVPDGLVMGLFADIAVALGGLVSGDPPHRSWRPWEDHPYLEFTRGKRPGS